jgi:integrase/recombinase XerD
MSSYILFYSIKGQKMSITKVRKPIGDNEYKKLMNSVRGDTELKDFNRTRFLRIFSLLYYSGCRLNELPQLTVQKIKEILTAGETTIVSHKVKSERILYFSPDAIKEFSKYFNLEGKEDSEYIITSWGKPRQQLHHISLIQLVNSYIHNVLGEQYSSHSFRSGIITDMAVRSVNPKIIQSFVGHRNISTTLSYVRPSEVDIKNALVR